MVKRMEDNLWNLSNVHFNDLFGMKKPKIMWVKKDKLIKRLYTIGSGF